MESHPDYSMCGHRAVTASVIDEKTKEDYRGGYKNEYHM